MPRQWNGSEWVNFEKKQPGLPVEKGGKKAAAEPVKEEPAEPAEKAPAEAERKGPSGRHGKRGKK